MSGRKSRSHAPASRVVIVVVVTAVAAIAAAVFADSSQASRVAADGAIYTQSQRVITASSAVRGNLGLTIILASPRASVDQDDVLLAIERVRTDLETLEQRAAGLDSMTDANKLTGPTLSTTSAAREILASIERAGNPDRQSDGAEGPIGISDAQYRTVAADLEAIESSAAQIAAEAQARIDAEGSAAGDAARMSSLLVALMVPAVATWSLFSAARRREERLKLRSELDKSISLVKARDDLIAGISHQLRTPLTAISGYALTMLEVPDDHDLVVEGLTVVERQAAELSRMVDDLVTMARLEDGPVGLRVEYVDAAREIETVLSANTSWRVVRTSLSPATVRVDRLRLRHILTNLLSNAFTHGGPSVIVKADRVESSYRIAVADDGDGVPSAMIDTVFEPYVHSAQDALVTGTLGLGLAVAKRLAEQMECRLTYQRTNGYTLFVLDIPLAAATQLPASERTAIG